MGMMKEFKEFAVKGNVIDLAVGVVIGGAFGKIVTSLVNDIVMPPIGVIIGGLNFNEFKWVIKAAVTDAAGAETAPEVAIMYGNFLQIILEFIIIAFCIFMVVKGINKLKKEKPAEEPAPAAPSNEEVLLGEIRDLLKNK